jgi:hypothetical protein
MHNQGALMKGICGLQASASLPPPGEGASPRYSMNKEAPWALLLVWTLGKCPKNISGTPHRRRTGNRNRTLGTGLGARLQPSDSGLLAKRKIGLPVGQEIYRLLRSVKDELGRNVPIAYPPPWNVDCGLLLAVASLSWLQYLCHPTARKNEVSHTRSACFCL